MPKKFRELRAALLAKMTPEERARYEAAVQRQRQIYEILQRPYTREFIQEDDGSWFARIVEFQGCMTVGETREEADQMLDDAALGWLEVALKDGDPIPPPSTGA